MSKLYKKYLEMKKENATVLYMFRVGIFFSFLADDAKYINQMLGLRLTRFNDVIFKCGFPVGSKDKYFSLLDRLDRQYMIIETIVSVEKEVINRIKNYDFNNITPMEAINILIDLSRLLNEE